MPEAADLPNDVEALKDLVKREQITPETAYMAANKKEEFEAMVSAEFLKQ